MIPEACFLAVDRERYVGYSALARRDAARVVRVNEKLGFRRTYVEVRLVRRPV